LHPGPDSPPQRHNHEVPVRLSQFEISTSAGAAEPVRIRFRRYRQSHGHDILPFNRAPTLSENPALSEKPGTF
jgi:hypothetical protein